MSRSASRSRPPLTAHNTGGVLAAKKEKKDEDDEVEVEDRGQALIRRRQKERKQIRRAKEKERERREQDGSLPGSGVPDEGGSTFGLQQSRSLGRSSSTSRSRAPSTDRRNEGYFSSHSQYAGSLAGDETPREGQGGLSPREEMAASVYSTAAEDEDEEGARDDRGSIVDEVVQEVVEEAGDDDEEEEDGSAEGDEGLTLKDRQDVSYRLSAADDRQSTLNIRLVYPSGNPLCTGNLGA
jgi:Ca2+:H+ antiporter